MKAFYPLIVAQFLSAFADNATLFAVIAIVLHNPVLPGWYVPALQSAFLAAFVVLAPWAGPFADRHAKPRVLLFANCIKAAGALSIAGGLEPLAGYALVGIGAALYAPAKYGVLPEMLGHADLVKANGWIEASTILAILLGTVVGAEVADRSVDLALAGIFGVYLLSAAVTLALPRPAARGCRPVASWALFRKTIAGFWVHPQARFALLGSSLFWAAGACLRVILVAWAPLVLHLPTAGDVAGLTLFLAVGIVAGAALAPLWIPLERLPRARWAAYAMALLIAALAPVEQLWAARGVLLAIGMAGGIFVVPINAAIQEIGHRSIGSGGAVAVQGFFENLSMLSAVGGYTLAAAAGAAPSAALAWLGGCAWLFTVGLSRRWVNRAR